MSLKWFVQKDELVEGPLSTEDVQTRLNSGQLGAQALIWGRGFESWQRLNAWNQKAASLENTVVNLHPAEPVAQPWHYAVAGKSYGPYPKPELIHQLKNMANLGEVMVWSKGMVEWAPLFEFHDMLNEIGVNKRQVPRADLEGRAIVKTSDSTLHAQMLTISEGGCGIYLTEGLVAGQHVQLEIESRAFGETLKLKAECRYVSEGVCGMKFINASSEIKGAIVQFVRQQTATRFAIKAA
ncbi:MAG TPA: GYF domain-containing protein [Bdellovibrionales bacterium]|nr:GYF domain-containing protein [Bdellovibrionales bacterium]